MREMGVIKVMMKKIMMIIIMKWSNINDNISITTMIITTIISMILITIMIIMQTVKIIIMT